MPYIIIAVVIILAILFFLKSRQTTTESSIVPYEKCYLLTKNEWYFYKQLKPIADSLGYSILAKIRLADLVRVKGNIEKSERAKYFSKIKSKHIDFILCNPENLAPILLIELDDTSHSNENRMKRDIFVNTVLEKTGYKLLRTTGAKDLESAVLQAITKDEKQGTENDKTPK